MTTDLRALAIRFADLWAVDPHQMADEIYSPHIVMERMANPEHRITGGAELHAVEDRLAALIPEHRHELVRVVVEGQVACLETTVVAPQTHEYAPACVWWWVDGSAKVAYEVGWFDWALRSTDSSLSHGTVPPSAIRHIASGETWLSFADEYARAWSDDPLGAGLALFSPACTSGQVGTPESRGLSELERDRTLEIGALPLTERRMDLHQVIGEGSCLAMLVVIGDAQRATRGTITLTLDDTGRIISERRYLDWANAIPRRQYEAGMLVGSPGWSPA
jgi:hypothetical protein